MLGSSQRPAVYRGSDLQPTALDREFEECFALQHNPPYHTVASRPLPTLVPQETADEFMAEVHAFLPW